MKIIALIFFPFPLLSFGQTKSSNTDTSAFAIRFEKNLSWKQILAKAKKERKHVFVDCFTTWCGWCKVMDNTTFRRPSVGDVFNREFISVRVQMDSSRKDGAPVRNWYADAAHLKHNYKVNAFPTFLFFSSDGVLIHQEVGYKKKDEFIRLASTAIDPSRNYQGMLAAYLKGIRDTAEMVSLAEELEWSGDTGLATQVAYDYLSRMPPQELFSNRNVAFMRTFEESAKVRAIVAEHMREYIEKLHGDEFYSPDVLNFIYRFPNLIHSEGAAFRFLYTHPDTVDKILGFRDWTEVLIKNTVRKEELSSKLWAGKRPITKHPDWTALETVITQKYGKKLAVDLVSGEKLIFYKAIGDWKTFADCFEERMLLYPPESGGRLFGAFLGDTYELNRSASLIFSHCNDTPILSRALRWNELAIRLEKDPGTYVKYYDTEANLLYKMGKVAEAVDWEQKAITLQRTYAGESKADYNATLKKIKLGKPTWPTN